MSWLSRSFMYDDRAIAAVESAKQIWNIGLVIKNIEYVLGHDPTVGDLHNEIGIRSLTFPGARSINEPDVDVVYEDRDPVIYIHDMTFSEARARHAGRA